jgi:hypothetical protein
MIKLKKSKIEIYETSYDQSSFIEYIKCICNNDIHMLTDMIDNYYNFCPFCGEKIEWID